MPPEKTELPEHKAGIASAMLIVYPNKCVLFVLNKHVLMVLFL